MGKHKNKIIAGVVIVLILLFTYWWGGNAPQLRGWNTDTSAEINTEQPSAPSATPEPAETAPVKTEEEKKQSPIVEKEIKPEEKPEIKEEIKDEYQTDPVPEGSPEPIEPQNAEVSDKELTCTLSVRCDTILNNLEWLDKEKVELVPRNGVIFEEKSVVFYEGESVFDLLEREMKENKIHMEFVNTPVYNSAYIEGIANFYEFDCGELSGWMYKVNNWFPNYGSSRYQLKAGDKVEWVYTCNLGADVGGEYSGKQGMN